MIRKPDWMLGKLVRISVTNNYMFRTPYDGTVALVIEVPKIETARPTARVMYHDGRIDSANSRYVDESLLVDVRDHEPDLVTVPGQHDA